MATLVFVGFVVAQIAFDSLSVEDTQSAKGKDAGGNTFNTM
jgi:hypothetical protein